MAKKQTVGMSVTEDVFEELTKRSKSMGISLSKYCSTILTNWVKTDKKLIIEEK